MATYTATIGLHQWEAKDPVLRTNFNEDFAKIDAAFAALDPRFGGVETARSWLEEAVARMGYEALQSRLAADAEGKVCPPGRGLVFDSFRSGDRVTLSGGCALKNGGGILLDTGPGLADFSVNYGNSRYVTIFATSEHSTREVNFQAAGNGTLNTLQIYMRSAHGTAQASVSLLQNGTTLWSGAVTVDDKVAVRTASPKVQLKKGVTYTVRVGQSGSYDLYLYTGPVAGSVGFQALCTPGAGERGTVTTAAQVMPAFRTVRAWVRHTGGTVGCSAAQGTGAFRTMGAVNTRECVDIRGRACTETEFSLPASDRPASGSVRFQISVQSSTDVSLYDFGAAFV